MLVEGRDMEGNMTERARCNICDRTFGNEDGLESHNKAKHPELIKKPKKKISKKRIRNWAIFIIIVGLIIWGIIGLSNPSEKTTIDKSNLNFEAPKYPIHWHPELTIKIDGEIYPIPANVGLEGVHMPIHTHDDANIGILHMENSRPTKETVTLGYFFKVWNKKFSENCIFEYCTDKGELQMYVNNIENNEFENYFMQDGDKILIEFNSNN